MFSISFINADLLASCFYFIFLRSTMSVLRVHSTFSSPPQRHNDLRFPSKKLSITFFHILILCERVGISLLILVAAGHWLVIEPGTSRCRIQHLISSITSGLLASYLYKIYIWFICQRKLIHNLVIYMHVSLFLRLNIIL